MDQMTTACVHHWVVESPAGPTSTGRCKRCGEEREFGNWDAPRYTAAGRLLSMHIHRQPRQLDDRG